MLVSFEPLDFIRDILHTGNIHRIIIHQRQFTVITDKNVTVLKVPVRDSRLVERCCHLQEVVSKFHQYSGPVDIRADILFERVGFHPVHYDSRLHAPCRDNGILYIAARYEVRELALLYHRKNGFQVVLNRLHRSMPAADRIFPSSDFVRIYHTEAAGISQQPAILLHGTSSLECLRFYHLRNDDGRGIVFYTGCHTTTIVVSSLCIPSCRQ